MSGRLNATAMIVGCDWALPAPGGVQTETVFQVGSEMTRGSIEVEMREQGKWRDPNVLHYAIHPSHQSDLRTNSVLRSVVATHDSGRKGIQELGTGPAALRQGEMYVANVFGEGPSVWRGCRPTCDRRNENNTGLLRCGALVCGDRALFVPRPTNGRRVRTYPARLLRHQRRPHRWIPRRIRDLRWGSPLF